MNQVILIGNLTKDPETNHKGEMAVTHFTIAVNDGYGDNQHTSYTNIVCFGKVAETCGRWLVKGSKVAIDGKIQTGSYEKDGRKVYTTDVIANNVEFLKLDGGF